MRSLTFLLFAKYYNYGNKIMKYEMAEAASRMGEMRTAYKILLRKSEVKNPIGRSNVHGSKTCN
jgi:hypothetical protein